MDLTFVPDGRAIIVHRAGDITIRAKDGTVLRNVAHVPIKPLTATEHGLLGVVPHPDFAQNHTLFFHASIGDTVADKDQVVRAALSDDNKLTFDYANPIIKIESPEKHNGSMMIIHKGFLYMAIGDTGADASPPVNRYASCLNKPNGKVLRMNLDGTAPADNPLSSLPMVTGCTTDARTSGAYSMQPPDKRIWAWGFRQPYRFWIDPITDLVWVGDVGEKAHEEVDIVGKGMHFGYPFEEGSTKYNPSFMPAGGCKGMVPSTDCSAPAHQYPNGGGDGCVIGGFILDGCGWPEAYKARYLYGDFNAGHIFTVQVTPDRKGIVPNSRKAFGTFKTLNGFKMGPDGAVYMFGFDATAIYRVMPKDSPPSCAAQMPAADAGTTPPVDAGAFADASSSGGSGGGGGAAGGGASGGASGGGGATGTGGRGGGSAAGGAGTDPGEGGAGDGPTASRAKSGCSYAGGQTGAGLLFGLGLAVLGRRRRRR
jgi:glucose/arabinose dehydrogenase